MLPKKLCACRPGSVDFNLHWWGHGISYCHTESYCFFQTQNNENSLQLLDFYVFFYFFRTLPTLFQDFPNFSTAFILTYEQCSAELKSCTTWDVWNPINNGINYISTGAGFQPSTVVTSFFHTFFLLVFLRSRTSWSKLLIWDLPHRPVSRCVSVLQCLGRETPESTRKPWKMETRFHIKRFQTWENIMKHSDISSVGRSR